MSTQQNADAAALLDALARLLEHPALPHELVTDLAEALGDTGGARYGLVDGVPLGAHHVAELAREHAARLRGSGWVERAREDAGAASDEDLNAAADAW
ncbi:hypothetical protein GXB85_13640 [Cellulomonas sp. APG4]|uniref:hypothetical protein n=1 Tax=Cellulomonas sp. APG4 TaxID=1538656 RepID=UPI0013799D1D|nr:hypothetical protein [Cellulomonas sp. APG4]NCT91985.1 hypothetical protein [Cellulomonas sp. APG4]